MKALKDLDLLDRFLFDNVMEDSDICCDVLSICVGEDVAPIMLAQKEKMLELSPQIRSIRMDIFSFDENEKVYNAEMQGKDTQNLPKRSRYYQAHLDVSLLEPGEVDFNKLNDSCLIVIMPFDLFGEKKYRYTFRYKCDEAENVCLKDGAVKIFLNGRGTNPEEVGDELVAFLKYVEDSSKLPEGWEGDTRLARIHNKVQQIKNSEEMGVKYMQDWEEKVLIKQAAKAEGKEEGIAEGEEKANHASIKNMLLKSKTEEEILDCIVGATREDIDKVKKEIKI